MKYDTIACIVILKKSVMSKSKQHKTIKQRLQENWKSGLTVSLVSIPLSVSLAVASGATPTMGIITALWAGFAAAFFWWQSL
jgi:MFS superfamily sulfate permease-like transporter